MDQNKEKTASEVGTLPHQKMLVISIKKPGKGKLIRITKEQIVLGTVDSADIKLSGDGVSPIHAVIELSQSTGICTIFDLASDTGVFVNGNKVVTSELKSGDRIILGAYELEANIDTVEPQVAAVSPSTRGAPERRVQDDIKDDHAALLLEDEAFVEEIFDFSKTSTPALEIVMSWRGTIFDVEHFLNEKEVTIGSDRRVNFAIPPVLASNRYVFVEKKGNDFCIKLDPSMKGVLYKKGKLQDLKEAAMSPAVVISGKDFAKITISGIDFYLHLTPSPPRIKKNRVFEKDVFFWQSIFTSLLLSGIFTASVLHFEPPKPVEVEQVPERLATILYHPEKYSSFTPKQIEKLKPENQAPIEQPSKEEKKHTQVNVSAKPVDLNKPIPKEINVATDKGTSGKNTTVGKAGGQKGQKEAKAGEGARAKGAEGTRGQKNAPKDKDLHQDLAKRPSPDGGKGQGGGKSEVGDLGNIDALKGATSKIQNLLSGSTEQLSKGGSKLSGFGGFTTQGSGGLALSGGGTGGGGTAEGLGGLSDKGKGGARVGTGLGASGTGSGFVGGKARVALRTGGPEETVVMGSIDVDAIAAILAQHRDEFRLCYEREINAENPDIRGSLVTSFEIGSTGRVTQAGIAESSIKNSNVERCVTGVIKRIEFPTPRGGGTVSVRYPIKYTPTGK